MLNSGEYLSNKDSIKNILISHGYPYSESSDYINTAALWRNGSDSKSVAIYWKDDKCIDFVDGNKFNIRTLISLVTNNKDDKTLEEYLSKNKINLNYSIQPAIKQQRIFSNEILKELLPIYDYWISRGISEEVLRETKGGVYSGDKGSLKNRFVFPIFNSKNQIIMLSSRKLDNHNDRPKWLIKGTKDCVYPAFINKDDIKQNNSVILLESIGDWLSLASVGIRTGLVMFGTELRLPIINYLLKVNIDKIYVSTNNDKNMAGNEASIKIYKKLSKYFSNSQIKIILPDLNDWNDELLNNKENIIKKFHK